jgi:cation:H+ antiporter
MLLTVAILIAGLILLTKGADWLVDGASLIAERLGISEFVIGITIVATGTSLPELVSSIYASYIGSSDIIIGNILGSNISNIALVLGIGAILAVVKFGYEASKRDLALVIGSAFLCFPILITGYVSRLSGLILMVVYFAYIFQVIRGYNNDKKKKKKNHMKLKNIGLVVLGLIAVAIGAKFTIDSALELVSVLGITERVAGLVIVAIGTSLPELATTIVAAVKKKGSMVIGNIAGSNAFNILVVLGAASAIRPLTINPLALSIDLPIMLLASLFFIFIWDRDVNRFEGIILLSFFLIYLGILF